MKYNKGFAPVVILLIVLGVLAVGGVAYFVGKSSAPKNEVADNSNYFPTTEQNYTPPTTNNNPPAQTPPPSNNPPQQQTPPPTPTCNPSITVLSPNGGEVYHVGQTITVKWKSCNLPSNDLVNINLMRSSNVHVVTTPDASNQFPIGNGSAQITVTATGVYPNTVQYGNVYKILINAIEPSSRDAGKVDAQDWSDNYFTINGPTPLSLTLPTPYVTSGNGIWPPVIQTSTTAYSCTPSGAGSDMETTQKIINGRTYCFTMSDGVGAGSVHLGYTYTTANGSGTKTTNFSINYVNNCDDYSGQQHTDCQAAHSMFANYNFDLFIDSLM